MVAGARDRARYRSSSLGKSTCQGQWVHVQASVVPPTRRVHSDERRHFTHEFLKGYVTVGRHAVLKRLVCQGSHRKLRVFVRQSGAKKPSPPRPIDRCRSSSVPSTRSRPPSNTGWPSGDTELRRRWRV